MQNFRQNLNQSNNISRRLDQEFRTLTNVPPPKCTLLLKKWLQASLPQNKNLMVNMPPSVPEHEQLQCDLGVLLNTI